LVKTHPAVFVDPMLSENGLATVFVSKISQGEVGKFTVIDPLGDTLMFELYGEDADLFDLNPITGALSLISPFPGTTGCFDTDSVYELIVVVSDSAGAVRS